jgi:hypothetical protein
MNYKEEHTEATSIVVEDWIRSLTITVVCKLPRHNASKEIFKNFFQTLGHRFIAGANIVPKYIMDSKDHKPPRIQLMGATN